MTADDRFGFETERSAVFAAGIVELVATAMILAPICLLIGVLLFLLTRRKKN